MAKLGDFQTLTGVKGNVFSLNSWLQMILGAFMLLVTFAFGQSLFQRAGSRIPAGGGKIESIINNPEQNPNQKVVL